MTLLKIRDGLLERENFFNYAEFGDILGSENIIKKDGYIQIFRPNRIERPLFYKNFVILIEKSNYDENDKQIDDEFLFYVSNNEKIFGTQDVNQENEVQSKYHKIFVYDNFLQTFTSENGKDWKNLGGINLYDEFLTYQGFRTKGNKPVDIKSYCVYNSPYISFYGFPVNSILKIYDSTNTLIKERLFDNTDKIDVFLDYNITNGKIEIYSNTNQLLDSKENVDITMGDAYMNTDSSLEIIYQNNVTDPTKVESFNTSDPSTNYVEIHNLSTEITYKNLKISVEENTDDIIELSLDNTTFNNTVLIDEIKPDEKIKVYISIQNKSGSSYNYGEFLFRVDN